MEILISGASTGIGRACTVHLARTGHRVWAGVRSQRDFDSLVKMNVRGVQPLFLDVTQTASIADAVRVIRKQAGMLHALVNNAGVAIGGPVEGLTLETWRQQFEVNLFGLIELTKACLPSLRESKGRIVNMSSASGKVASPFMAPYAASKFALEALSDSLRRELRPQGIRVSVIEPGSIKTPIWQKSIAAAEARKFGAEVSEIYGARMERFAKVMQKMDREGSPVAVVVKAVEHALTAREPRIRYPVGRGVALRLMLARIIPDRGLDRLLGF